MSISLLASIVRTSPSEKERQAAMEQLIAAYNKLKQRAVARNERKKWNTV